MSEDTTPQSEPARTDVGAALLRLIEVASRDDHGLEALEVLRDALDAAISARQAEAREFAEANEAIVPIDATNLAVLIDRAAEKLAKDEAISETTAQVVRADTHPEPALSPNASREDRDAILPGLAERAQVKADLVRACATAIESGDPVDESLIHRARSMGASTWMADLVDVAPHDLLVMADCFAALSETAEYASLLRQDGAVGRERFPHAVRSMAAVLSALRIATLEFRQTADEDHLAGFDWLRETTAAEQIFVERHMRLDDPYDPEEVGAVVDDIHEELEAIREATAKRDRRKKALGRVRYHAGLIGRGRGSERDQQKVVDAVEELVTDGVPPSSVELRDILLPIRGELPAAKDTDGGYGRVVEQLDLHRSRVETAPEETEHEEAPSPQVQQVAQLIGGTELVIIGGELRVEAEEALKDAFGLSGLTWIHLADNPSNENFARAIARDEVSVVVLLIRWVRHSYGDAKRAADLHGKPFVRAPGGYNRNAIAAAIMDQASDRLAARSG